MERPLTDDVARPVRAYLSALVPAVEVSDAWHELIADVDYWSERDLLPVLRLAHQVAVQHQRVTPEVAALALADAGIDDPDDVAVVLDTDPDTARDWTERATASRQGDAPAATASSGRFADRGRPAGPASPAATAPTADPAPTVTLDADDDPLRAGFDGDRGVPGLAPGARPRVTTRWIVLGALLLWAVVVGLWALTR